MRRPICLAVEGNLVDDWDLKAGDLRLAVFLAKPEGEVQRQVQKGLEQPVKKYLGSLASHCQGSAILAECDMGDGVRVFLQCVTSAGLRYW